MVEIGQAQEGFAPECLEAAAGVGGPILQQPVAHPAADVARPADPPYGVQQRAPIGGEVHDADLALVKAADTTHTQPASKARPPNGVTGPSQRGPPKAKRYSEPENSTVPATQQFAAQLKRRMTMPWDVFCQAAAAKRATAWTNW